MTAKTGRENDKPFYERAWDNRFTLMPWYVAAAVLAAGIYCSLPWEALVGEGTWVGLPVAQLARYGPIVVVALAVQLLGLSRTESTPALVLLGIVVVSGATWAAALPVVVSSSFASSPGAGLLSLVLMPAVLLAVTLLLGVFWWASKLNRKQARVENEQRSWSDIAKQFGLGDTTRQNHVDKPEGVSGTLVWPKGRYRVREVLDKREALEGAMGLPSGTLRLMLHGRATDRVSYVAFRDDPQTEAEEWPGVPLDPATGEAVGEMSCTVPFPIGKTERGEEVTEEVWRPKFGTFNDLFGGDQGSGKSGGLNLRIGHLACCGDAVQAFADFKGGVELGPWAKVGLFTVTDTAQVMAIMPAIRALLDCRQELLGTEFMPGRIWIPRGMPRSPGDPEQAPLFKLWVDEIAELMASTDGGRTSRDQSKVMETMASLVRNDRALGIAHGGATQQFGLNATGDSGYRSRFNRRHCYRVGQPEEESKILGKNITAGAVDIDPNRPGTEFIVEQQQLRREPVRDYYFTDELVDQIADIREFGGCELERYTDDAMAAASDLYAEQREQRRDAMRAKGYLDDGDAEVIVPVRPEEYTRPWVSVTGPAERAADQEAGRESDTPRDVPLSAMFAEYDARKEAESRAGAPSVSMDKPDRPLSTDEAHEAAMAALREAGPAGLSASAVFRAAGRKSSWFHETWKRQVVESEGGDGSVVRTAEGHYALAMATQRKQ